jgi:hypothetical protein
VGSSPGIGRSRVKAINFFGYNLSSQKDINSLLEETRMSATLNGRFDLLYFGGLQDEALMRAVKIDMANKMKIPIPDKKILDDFVEKYKMFIDKDGKFSPSAYNTIIGSLVRRDHDAETLKRTMENDFRLQFIENAIGGCGFALEQQAEELVKQNETKWSFYLVELNADEPSTNFSEEELKAFFDENPGRYYFPERFIATYVEFEKDAFRESMTPATKDILKKFYSDKKAQFDKFKDDKEALKKEIIDEYEKSQLKKLAIKAAGDFVYGLYTNGIAYDSEMFHNILKANRITEKPIPCFDLDNLPTDLNLPSKAIKNLVDLDKIRYFSDPYETINGNAAVLFLKEKIYPVKMSFDEARSLVQADYVKKEASAAFDRKCSEILKEIESSLKKDVTFQAIALEKQLKIQDHKDKTLNDLQRSDLQQVLDHISKGNIGRLVKDKKSDELCNLIYIYNMDVPEVTDTEKLTKAMENLESESADLFARYSVIDMAEDVLTKYKELNEK